MTPEAAGALAEHEAVEYVDQRQLFAIMFENESDVTLVEEYGGQVLYESSMLPVVDAFMTPEAAQALAEHPAVRYTEPDLPIYPVGQALPWGIDRVFGDEEYPFGTWGISTGQGVAVAVLDTGIDGNHEDLPGLAGGTNVYQPYSPWDYDAHGHGTAVAGVIAGLDNGLGVVGVAPGVMLYSVVVTDGYGGSASAVRQGIEWVVWEAELFIPIINMSLALRDDVPGLDTLEAACDFAYEQGHLLVASAGNNAGYVRYPAAFGSVIAVSASTGNDSFWHQSNSGPEIEFIAPGVDILTTQPGDQYGVLSGTSFSCPHVAGVAALIWGAHPALTNDQVRGILRNTAENLGLGSWHQGYGLVRADSAVYLPSGVEGYVGYSYPPYGTFPLQGAKVEVDGEGKETFTDYAGYYEIQLQPGSYTVKATYLTFKDKIYHNVQVLEGEYTTLNFILEQEHPGFPIPMGDPALPL
jgi:subtilisin